MLGRMVVMVSPFNSIVTQALELKESQKAASGGEGGEATLGKNTSKADCECALFLVPRSKSHSPSARASPDSIAGDYAGAVTRVVTLWVL